MGPPAGLYRMPGTSLLPVNSAKSSEMEWCRSPGFSALLWFHEVVARYRIVSLQLYSHRLHYL